MVGKFHEGKIQLVNIESLHRIVKSAVVASIKNERYAINKDELYYPYNAEILLYKPWRPKIFSNFKSSEKS